jgi:hypothetical protein
MKIFFTIGALIFALRIICAAEKKDPIRLERQWPELFRAAG